MHREIRRQRLHRRRLDLVVQGDLLRENCIFSSAEIQDMQAATNGLRGWYFSPQPLRLLFCLNRLVLRRMLRS